jgi:hypothetical protein
MSVVSDNFALVVVLVALNVVAVAYMLPHSAWHCQVQSVWLTLAMILLYGCILPQPLAVFLGLIWLLGTIPCFSIGPAHDGILEERFTSGRGERTRQRRKAKPKKAKRPAQPAKPAPPFQNADAAATAAQASSEFTKKLMNSLGMQHVEQKRETFQNQIKKINHEIAGLQRHFQEKGAATTV